MSAVGDATRLAEDTVALLEDDDERARVAAAGRGLYDREFDVRHSIRALTGVRPAPLPEGALTAGEIR
jgi:hypothetical protein